MIPVNGVYISTMKLSEDCTGNQVIFLKQNKTLYFLNMVDEHSNYFEIKIQHKTIDMTMRLPGNYKKTITNSVV